MLNYKRAIQMLQEPPPPALAESSRHMEARENLQRLVDMTRAYADQGLLMFVEFYNENIGHWGFVHPSASYEGKFRWTSFIEDGWWGHYDEFDSPEEAFFDMLYSGFDVMEVGALQRAMKSPTWPKYKRNPWYPYPWNVNIHRRNPWLFHISP